MALIGQNVQFGLLSPDFSGVAKAGEYQYKAMNDLGSSIQSAIKDFGEMRKEKQELQAEVKSAKSFIDSAITMYGTEVPDLQKVANQMKGELDDPDLSDRQKALLGKQYKESIQSLLKMGGGMGEPQARSSRLQVIEIPTQNKDGSVTTRRIIYNPTTGQEVNLSGFGGAQAASKQADVEISGLDTSPPVEGRDGGVLPLIPPEPITSQNQQEAKSNFEKVLSQLEIVKKRAAEANFPLTPEEEQVVRDIMALPGASITELDQKTNKISDLIAGIETYLPAPVETGATQPQAPTGEPGVTTTPAPEAPGLPDARKRHLDAETATRRAIAIAQERKIAIPQELIESIRGAIAMPGRTPDELNRQSAFLNEQAARIGEITRQTEKPAQEAAKQEEQDLKAEARRQIQERKAGELLGLVEDLESRYQKYSPAPGPAAAIARVGASFVPTTEASNIKARVKQITGRLTQSELQDMRNSSPTGAALGNVSNLDVNLVRDSATTLQMLQSPQEFTTELSRVKKSILESIHGTKAQRDKLLQDGKITQAQYDSVSGLFPGEARKQSVSPVQMSPEVKAMLEEIRAGSAPR
jgi:hypothetical protein